MNESVHLIQRTKQALITLGDLKLHKIASIKTEVMNAFTTDDCSPNLKNLDIAIVALPTQRILNVVWSIEHDKFLNIGCPRKNAPPFAM